MVKANWPGNPYAGMGVQNLIKQMQKECQHDANYYNNNNNNNVSIYYLSD